MHGFAGEAWGNSGCGRYYILHTVEKVIISRILVVQSRRRRIRVSCWVIYFSVKYPAPLASTFNDDLSEASPSGNLQTNFDDYHGFVVFMAVLGGGRQ